MGTKTRERRINYLRHIPTVTQVQRNYLRHIHMATQVRLYHTDTPPKDQNTHHRHTHTKE